MCELRGFDYCPVDEDTIGEYEYMYIGIGCIRSCEYRLRLFLLDWL